MTPLSKYQLERADLTVTIEQGRRVEAELFAENTRGMRTMGELLKARLFGSSAWAISLRQRMINYDGGRKVSLPQKAPRGTEGRPGFDSPRLHPDLDAEEAWHPSHLNLVVDPLIGRLKVPARYRKDESDR